MRRWSLGFLFFLLGQIGFAADYTNYVRLFSFGGENGATPVGDLIEGSDGKLYGTTAEGGLTNGSFPNGMGVVFSLNKDGSGFSVLHRFADDGQDGQSPYGGLVEGNNGEFYGTTRNGGTAGGGTVFTINTKVSSYAVLKSVTGHPEAGLLITRNDGWLYGTMSAEDFLDEGLVFRIRQNGTGFSEVSALIGAGGATGPPISALMQASNGLLYGTSMYSWETLLPGVWDLDYGAVFQLSTNGSGFNALVDPFTAQDLLLRGYKQPMGTLFEGSDGSLYGTASQGSAQASSGGGCVFRVSTEGGWQFAVIHQIGTMGEGFFPMSALAKGSDGALYGTTTCCNGSAFKLNEDGSSFKVLKAFIPVKGDGYVPHAKLLMGSDDGFYGTTSRGGDSGYGIIFALHRESRSWFRSLQTQTNGTLASDALGAAGVAFRLQCTTNLSEPIWKDVATNTASVIGVIAFTNLVASEPQSFFRLTPDCRAR